MRKISLVVALMLSAMAAFAQDSARFKNAYISPGVGISEGSLTYSIEVGVYNPSVWLGYVSEFTPVNTKTIVFTGPKFYKHMASYGNIVDTYVYAAVKLGVTEKNVPIAFEPGYALVFTVSKNIGIQLTFSSPIIEGTPTFSPIILSTSFGLNWYF